MNETLAEACREIELALVVAIEEAEEEGREHVKIGTSLVKAKALLEAINREARQ